MPPDLILLGQVTVDHVVPARPGPWREQLGGNALYAAAGARLWLAPERIGVVTRMGAGCPFAPRAHLARAGIERVVVAATGREQLVEWFLYEEDGSCRSLPRNRALRNAGGEGAGAGADYLAHLEAQSPSASDIPAEWLPAGAVHLAPQVLERHEATLRTLAPRVGFVSVDPSPHYSAGRSVEALAHVLAPATAFLPSEREVAHLVDADGWPELAGRLAAVGFPEVVVKRGAAGGNPLRAGKPTGAGARAAGRSARSDRGRGCLLRRVRRLSTPGPFALGGGATGHRRRLHGDRMRGGGRGPRPRPGLGPTAARREESKSESRFVIG